MTNTKTTTKTNHYFRALVALAMMVAMLVASGVALAATTTFSNPSPLQIVDNDKAAPYPSQIAVQNLSEPVSDVSVRLNGFIHGFPDDVDVLLVGPQGQKALLMSDVGGGSLLDTTGVNLTLDDEATRSLPDVTPITSGAYKPTQGTPAPVNGDNPVPANFPSPAPTGPYARDLSVFDGTDPNGIWDLYVIDDSAISSGQFAGGWSLQITTGSPDTRPDTFTVNSTADTADATPEGTCDSPCTLREAIQEANANADPTEVDRINFKISGTGVHTISPTSPLPAITEPVIINGYTQPGASPNTLAKGTNAKLKINLNGTKAGSADGLDFNARNTVVRGLVINRFGGRGIGLLGGSESDGTRIEGNFIGTNPAGTLARANHSHGVGLTANSNVSVGGTSLAARNLISGNEGNGVFILRSVDGTDGHNKVQGNLIGTDKKGTSNLGNGTAGVLVIREGNNTVGGKSTGGANIIAFNGSDGVALLGDDNRGDNILSNSIFSNKGLGIDLAGPNEDGATNVSNANDPGDKDLGPNGLQNKPTIASVTNADGKTIIKGKLSSKPNQTYSVRFFTNPSGNEGKLFIGQKKVTTGSDGKGSFMFSPAQKVGVGKTVTATATGPEGTSEFSTPKKVVAS